MPRGWPGLGWAGLKGWEQEEEEEEDWIEERRDGIE